MRRDTSSLLDRTFDLLVVGGGIYGACIAWDATLRGLSVAVVDRGDFGAGTSANSLGIAHGGLRYLARGDIPRMRESIRERSALLRIAPRLVEPLPVLIPTYGGTNGPAAFRAALLINDLVSSQRNQGIPASHHIPPGRVVSRTECLGLFPWFPASGLKGGALWYDGRLLHPERLTLSFVRSAAEQGAVPANYLRVDRLVIRDRAVCGARVTDLEQGKELEVKSRVVVVAAGPWTEGLISGTLEREDRGPASERALAVNLRVQRRLSAVAIGAKSFAGPGQDPVCGGDRYLFAVPDSEQTLLGTWYATSQPRVRPEQGVASLIREFNQACPGLELSRSEVTGVQWGWLPLKGTHESGRPNALAERPRMIDHSRVQGIRHLFSVEGVKYTTARSVAQEVVDRVFQDLGRVSPTCRTAETALNQVAEIDPSNPSDIGRAVHQDMALRLSDIVFRRSSLRSCPRLERSVVVEIARVAGAELGWDRNRQEAEIEEVMQQSHSPIPVEEPAA
jgi:glycerol-3-phosphate dehydrogenase